MKTPAALIVTAALLMTALSPRTASADWRKEREQSMDSILIGANRVLRAVLNQKFVDGIKWGNAEIRKLDDQIRKLNSSQSAADRRRQSQLADQKADLKRQMAEAITTYRQTVRSLDNDLADLIRDWKKDYPGTAHPPGADLKFPILNGGVPTK